MPKDACEEIRKRLREATATWEHQRQVKSHPWDVARSLRAVQRLKRRLHALCGESVP